MELLTYGKKAFTEIILEIEKATNNIFINMFVWRDDTIGNLIMEKLLEAANRGVKITISKDKYASFFEIAEETKQTLFHKKKNFLMIIKAVILNLLYPSQKRHKGYKQRENPLLEQLIIHHNVSIYKENIKKDHSKFFIFDDQTMIFGGMNIEDKEYDCDLNHRQYFDFMIRIIDKAIVEEFLAQYYQNQKGRFSINRKIFKTMNIQSDIYKLIDNTQEEIIIAMAFLNNQKIIKKLIHLLNCGKCVTILMAKKMHLANNANLRALRKIMKKSHNQLNLYLSDKIIHAKALIVDQKQLFIGSSNFTNRDFHVLDQVNLQITNQQIVAKTLTAINQEIKQATLITSYQNLKYHHIKAFIEKISM